MYPFFWPSSMQLSNQRTEPLELHKYPRFYYSGKIIQLMVLNIKAHFDQTHMLLFHYFPTV